MVIFGLCRTFFKKGKVMAYQSVNPTTGEVVKTFKDLTDKHLEDKIADAARCFDKP
jgi:acyl-CoA reductase-like NAD-dependent aldehyde dehydrogenase